MLSFLETVAPYNTLDEQGLQSLANIAIRRNYKKNMVIIQQGDDTNSMFILIEGEMRVYVEDEEGKQLTVRILNPGHSFGEVALIGDFPRTASVMTLTDSVVAAFSRERYLSFLEQYPQISIALAVLRCPTSMAALPISSKNMPSRPTIIDESPNLPTGKLQA
jgi:CRP/FNR family cyclic AMP-dependent transcriptional regulator